MARKNTTTKKLKNKEMNSEVYKLRRKVIEYIYEIKEFYPDLPRIDVRITENNERIAGVGRMGNNIIWITEGYVASRGLVYHEVLHAAFAQEHVAGCPLMSGKGTSHACTKSQCKKLFLQYAK